MTNARITTKTRRTLRLLGLWPPFAHGELAGGMFVEHHERLSPAQDAKRLYAILRLPSEDQHDLVFTPFRPSVIRMEPVPQSAAPMYPPPEFLAKPGFKPSWRGRQTLRAMGLPEEDE